MHSEGTRDTHPAIVLESDARLIRVRCFDKDKLMFPHFVQDALSQSTGYFGNEAGWSTDVYHVIPGRNDGLHVEVAWEKRDDPIRYNLAVFHQDTSKIPNYGWVIPHLEARANGNLITASGNDLGFTVK
jgi:hypothetical protein